MHMDFVSVKTRLSITCATGIYAIILIIVLTYLQVVRVPQSSAQAIPRRNEARKMSNILNPLFSRLIAKQAYEKILSKEFYLGVHLRFTEFHDFAKTITKCTPKWLHALYIDK